MIGAPIAARGPAAVSDLHFARFRALIERVAGIYLADSKKPLLVARLGQRVRELQLRDFGAYYERVLDDADEQRYMLDRICTNETQFFREPHHFDFLADQVVPRWREQAAERRRSRRIAVWSAGCSTGEEPYSIAMLFATLLPDWDISILATDLSQRALAHAEAAIYTAERAASVPYALRRTCLLRGVGGQRGNVKIAPDIRARVRFERMNLTEAVHVAGGLDLVLCRNVLIYFRPNTRFAALEQLVASLSIGGLLLLGHAEHAPGGLPLVTLAPTIYERVEAHRR